MRADSFMSSTSTGRYAGSASLMEPCQATSKVAKNGFSLNGTKPKTACSTTSWRFPGQTISWRGSDTRLYAACRRDSGEIRPRQWSGRFAAVQSECHAASRRPGGGDARVPAIWTPSFFTHERRSTPVRVYFRFAQDSLAGKKALMACSVAESYDYCQVLAKKTARNFYYSFLTLPRDRLRAMCVLYSFMRVTDDLGDSEGPADVRAASLKGWRASLVRAAETGECEHPVLPALVDIVRTYKIPIRYLLDVITGVETDLNPVAFDTFERLADYCYHVAGAVGLACIHLWGYHDERALAAAVDCGTAF